MRVDDAPCVRWSQILAAGRRLLAKLRVDGWMPQLRKPKSNPSTSTGRDGVWTVTAWAYTSSQRLRPTINCA